jgi:hypothetical protein
VNPNGFGVFRRPPRASPFRGAQCRPITARRGLRPHPAHPTQTGYLHGREPKRFRVFPRPSRAAPFRSAECGPIIGQRGLRPHSAHRNQNHLPSRS